MVCTTLCAQNSKPNKLKLVIDENNQPIMKVDTIAALKPFLYNTKKIELDTGIVFKALPRFKFGKLETSKLIQLKNLMKRDSIEFIDKNFIILHYKDSIFNSKQHLNKVSSYSKKESLSDSMKLDIETNFLGKRKNFDLAQKKCFRKIKKAKAYFFTDYISKESYKPKNFNYKFTPNYLKSLFFKENRIVILKPSGEYFSYETISEKSFKNLMSKNWDSYIEDLKGMYSNNNHSNLKNNFEREQYYELSRETLPNRNINVYNTYRAKKTFYKDSKFYEKKCFLSSEQY